ncbi:uncharacterized protein FOMMEDRAFT_25366 [Fomitiporia mediterranea MF3/22]|uniref:uncharacterized protein n=1 Tax=Fomitiporia mediterranea (strain MF3/22) TaxID=694068 RepID=UPI00044096B5|nr:uncharacterized protein FOMMEDRAFT_25366 [Fomitiporia mediterranea MF3/22]EJD08220.1 hypothetical protein FOMMEDRAFT_25366 [Fomitiporia mediterranea MF3/22]
MTLLTNKVVSQHGGEQAMKVKPNTLLPPLEDLIANYGDAASTTWIEDKFSVWRHLPTGAAIGFAMPYSSKPITDFELVMGPGYGAGVSISDLASLSNERSSKWNGFLIAWGNPLCTPEQVPQVVNAFLKWCNDKCYSPIWCCVSPRVEQILADVHGWRAISCIQEDALDPRISKPEENKEVRKHIRRAQREGCKIIQDPDVPCPEVREEINELIREWKAGRKGIQVHLTNVEPWRDVKHRKYFYAQDKHGKIVGFLFLAKVGEGWVIKDSIGSNDAPKNITEWLIAFAIHSLADAGESRLTFGGTPTASLYVPENANLGPWSIYFLSKAYGGIERALLGNKRVFHMKFGIIGEPIFMCFPPYGLGIRGFFALMSVLTS